MSLQDTYQELVRSGQYRHDPQQGEALAALQRLTDQLLKQPAIPHSNAWIARARHWLAHPHPARIQGCYLWGGVGRGKTQLMDLFFQRLPGEHKLRIHFHRFMQSVHTDLTRLKGQQDPLKQVGRHLARQYRLICIDEFHVQDISDAMILHGLIESLFQHAVVLVFTANSAPNDLYKNGLQRERFVATIELIQCHCEVIRIAGKLDHRRVSHSEIRHYLTPDNVVSKRRMEQYFQRYAGPKVQYNVNVPIQSRTVPVVALGKHCIWFEFETLCGGPRSTADYIEIAERYKHLIISDTPVMDETLDDKARRFINLVDELYDRRTRLLISAQQNPECLYQGRLLVFEFQRTVSRLNEMCR